MWIYIAIVLFIVTGAMALYFKMEEVQIDLDIAEYLLFEEEQNDIHIDDRMANGSGDNSSC